MNIGFIKIDKGAFRNEWGLSVHSDQVVYVCENIEEYVESWKHDAHITCYLITESKVPVGFFALDLDRERHPYMKGENALTLRCFFIDRRFQGRGLALGALRCLERLLESDFPSTSHIYLIVNRRNKAALGLYQSAAFTILDFPTDPGNAGPTYAMAKAVKNRG